MKRELASHFNLRSRLVVIVAVALSAMVPIATLALMDERSRLMEDRAVKTRHLVESAHGVLAHFHALQRRGELTEGEAKRAALDTIRTMRYDGSEYFWINDFEPRMVMHPMMPELDGKDLSDFTDPNGKRLFVEFVDTVRKDGAGFVDYLWPKPDFTQPVPKISYVKGFSPWGWVIGSGIYIDDVNRIFWEAMRRQVGIIAVAILLLGGLMVLVVRRVEREINGYAAQLARSNAELCQAATVFENTKEGVMIADAANRVVAVNRAFVEITGYGADELIGRTPEVLRSSRQDKAFYRRIGEAIKEYGHWQGELWDRRKNGEDYPAWLSISVVKDEDGQVTHHVSVFSDITVLKESEARLDQLAHHDPLTGLLNRLRLNARAEHALARARRNEKQMAVLFLDSTASNTSTTPWDTLLAICSCSKWLSASGNAYGTRTPSAAWAATSSPFCWRIWTTPGRRARWPGKSSAHYPKKPSCSGVRSSSRAASASAHRLCSPTITHRCLDDESAADCGCLALVSTSGLCFKRLYRHGIGNAKAVRRSRFNFEGWMPCLVGEICFVGQTGFWENLVSS